eukprot:744893-Amorphochlora_amoeboformis.AAC.2
MANLADGDLAVTIALTMAITIMMTTPIKIPITIPITILITIPITIPFTIPIPMLHASHDDSRSLWWVESHPQHSTPSYACPTRIRP